MIRKAFTADEGSKLIFSPPIYGNDATQEGEEKNGGEKDSIYENQVACLLSQFHNDFYTIVKMTSIEVLN